MKLRILNEGYMRTTLNTIRKYTKILWNVMHENPEISSIVFGIAGVGASLSDNETGILPIIKGLIAGGFSWLIHYLVDKGVAKDDAEKIARQIKEKGEEN